MLDLFKLEKLTVTAYSDGDRTKQVGDPFEAMFNPTSYARKYEIRYAKDIGINNSKQKVNYARSGPEELNIKLVLDGTGVHQMGITNLFGENKTVSERVEEFLDLTFRMNGDIHEPNYLLVSWGGETALNFECRLSTVDISYSSFNRDGTPLRAELDATFLSDTAVAKRMALESKTSPDLTHTRMVKSGDTLPLLTKAVYGSASHYVRVAQVNRLDDFRNLTPGQELFFPPLEK